VWAVAPIFRMVCSPAALAGAPQGWTAETLRDGELALLVDDGGLEAINAAAHALDMVTVPIVRKEETPAEQAQTVIAFADSYPLVWVGAELTDAERTWARERRPMTLLVEVDGALADGERGRIERFLSLLARQTE
jgi:hypothetical protein